MRVRHGIRILGVGRHRRWRELRELAAGDDRAFDWFDARAVPPQLPGQVARSGGDADVAVRHGTRAEEILELPRDGQGLPAPRIASVLRPARRDGTRAAADAAGVVGARQSPRRDRPGGLAVRAVGRAARHGYGPMSVVRPRVAAGDGRCAPRALTSAAGEHVGQRPPLGHHAQIMGF